MERLTKRLDGFACYIECNLACRNCNGSCGMHHSIVSRLADYEDTGLTPEEIKTITSTTELRINTTLTEAEVRELMGMLEQQPDNIMVFAEDKAEADL